MTIHLFLFTITIKKHQETPSEIENRLLATELTEQMKDRKFSTYLL